MIFNNDSKKTKSSITPTAQALSEIHKKQVSDRLKIVDKFIKDGNLDEAQIELNAVKTIDPKNGYIFALEGRIDELRKTKDNSLSAESLGKVNESSPGNEIEKRVENEYLEKLTEEVHKVEERIEAAYHDRFMEEIGKGEQRITEALKEERGRHDAERAALIGILDQEKEKLLKELKKETRKLFEVEFKKMDDSYRKLLTDEIRKVEEDARAEISVIYGKAIAELKETVIKEKSQLLDEERKYLIEETRKQTGNELQKHIMEELAKARTMMTSNREEHEEDGMTSQAVVEEKPDADSKNIEEQIEAKLSELEKASEERYRKSIQEARGSFDNHLLEVHQNGWMSKTEIESKLAGTQKEHEIDFGIKSDEQLAQEREQMEKLRETEFKDIRDGVNWKDRPRWRKLK